eukprot:6106000-Karenia_brevis.AAC.1
MERAVLKLQDVTKVGLLSCILVVIMSLGGGHIAFTKDFKPMLLNFGVGETMASLRRQSQCRTTTNMTYMA